MKAYIPKPIDLSAAKLSDDLYELQEAIAENTHEVWAQERLSLGWSYGPQRDDNKLETPCLVAYSELPESEKLFDRKIAMDTLKLVNILGYDIIKREETELYRLLKERISRSREEFRCRRCGNAIYKYQVFCDRCGQELKMDWKNW